jgi:hypothetical protein
MEIDLLAHKRVRGNLQPQPEIRFLGIEFLDLGLGTVAQKQLESK